MHREKDIEIENAVFRMYGHFAAVLVAQHFYAFHAVTVIRLVALGSLRKFVVLEPQYSVVIIMDIDYEKPVRFLDLQTDGALALV